MAQVLGDKPSAIRLSQATRCFPSGKSIGPISFDVPEGSAFGLIGPNGAGKSTLMRLILGLDRPDAGTIDIHGERVRFGVPMDGLSGMVEEPKFFPYLSGYENLRAVFPPGEDLLARAREVLCEVGLSDVGAKPIRAYSQGMRQRLGIARVLLAEPRVLVLDEPTNGLDPLGIRWLRGLVKQQVTKGRTVVVSSHLLHEIQATCDSFGMIIEGALIASDRVSSISGFNNLEDMYFDLASSGST